MTRGSRILTWIFVGIFVLLMIGKGCTVWTDYLWFKAMGQGPVFTTILGTKVLLGLVCGVVFFLWLWGNLRIARLPLPEDITLIGRRLMPEEEREQIEEYADRALLLFSLIAGLMAGLVASGNWLPWLQYTHPVPFGEADPLFGKDASFYVFKLSFLQFIYRFAFYGIIITLIVSVLVHLYQEAIRIAGNTIQSIARARAHIYGLVALAMLVKIWGYRLGMLGLVFSNQGGVFSGASYTDVHARMPVLWALMGLCAIGAVIVVANIRSRRLFWPAGTVAVLLLFSFLGGSMYPLAVQKLVVEPTQYQKEEKFIDYNIEATNKAFALDKIRNEDYKIGSGLTWQDIENNRETIDNIRLWDYRPLEHTMDETQRLRAYYDFPDVDVDRYHVAERYRQVMLAPRQIDANKIPDPQTWVKSRLQYTHGFGAALAPVTEVEHGDKGEGMPNYWVKDIPPVSQYPALDIRQPRVYYSASVHPRFIELIQMVQRQRRAGQLDEERPGGDEQGETPMGAEEQELMDERPGVEPYVVVNTKEGEVDYPRLDDDRGGNVTSHYEGKGGVPVGNFLRRLVFAIRFHDINVLLTQSINKDSRVMIYRTLPERIQRLCPSYFLLCDPDPYLTIIDGRLQWIDDTYTHSRKYPYSKLHRMVNVNYLRNSVKAVCDAYDGIPRFYIVQPDDPLVQCYKKIFPTLFEDEPMPDEVRKHIRYPQLQFIVQSQIYADYHMLDTATFYQREDSWTIPVETYGRDSNHMVEAYYVLMRLPGHDEPEFVLMVPFALSGRERSNMLAWLAGRCDGENYGELLCYRMPKDMWVAGPAQVETRIGNNPEFSEKETLWSQRGSRIIRGNLLAIPIEDMILYVEPVYITGTATPIPQLKLVVVADNEGLALGEDLDDALRNLVAGRGEGIPEPAKKPEAEPEEPEAKPEEEKPAEVSVPESARELLKQALELDAEANRALNQGKLGEYQQLHKQVTDLIDQAYKEMAPSQEADAAEATE